MKNTQKPENNKKPLKTNYDKGVAEFLGGTEKEISESEPVKNYEKARIEGRIGRPRKIDKKS